MCLDSFRYFDDSPHDLIFIGKKISDPIRGGVNQIFREVSTLRQAQGPKDCHKTDVLRYCCHPNATTHTAMKFTSLALLAIVGSVSAGKPQLSVRSQRRLRFRVSSFCDPFANELTIVLLLLLPSSSLLRSVTIIIILPIEGCCSCPLQTQIADLGQGWTVQGTGRLGPHSNMVRLDVDG
jgi:hypothetical protein